MVAALLLVAPGAHSSKFDPEQQIGIERVKQGSPGSEKSHPSAGRPGVPRNSDTDAPLDSSRAEGTAARSRARPGDPAGTIIVPFLYVSDDLAPGAVAILEHAAAQLAAASGPVQIAGHTSGHKGKVEANQILSERRARRVRQFLIEHGVAAERLTAAGYGQSQPRDTNDTKVGRSHNRRVEIKRG